MVTDDWRSRLKDGNELRTYNSKTRGHSTSLEKTGDQPFVDITASDQSQSRDSDQVSDDFPDVNFSKGTECSNGHVFRNNSGAEHLSVDGRMMNIRVMYIRVMYIRVMYIRVMLHHWKMQMEKMHYRQSR